MSLICTSKIAAMAIACTSQASAGADCPDFGNFSATWPVQMGFEALPQAKCGAALTHDGKAAKHCRWEFDYRDDFTSSLFSDLTDRLSLCIGASGSVQADQGVNHPDSYELVEFSNSEFTVGLSLKDKAALGATFIFMSVRGNSN